MILTSLWKFIKEKLEGLQPVILLCVVDSKGSSPGRKGFRMAVTTDELHGSIGGGIMEHKFVELAREKLNNESIDPVLKRQIHNKEASSNRSGMICSGEQTIVLFQLTSQHLQSIEQLIRILEKNHCGQLKISPDEIIFSEYEKSDESDFFIMKSENDWEYKEYLGYKNHLCIVGGGHCALAFSRIMSTMDFYIRLYEERKNLNTFNDNNFVHEKITLDSYEELQDKIPDGENVYVTVMTFGYRSDNLSVRSIINKDFKYLGVLGSKSKMAKMFEEWRKDFLPENKLQKIFAPIGISINSRTPDEIAISIAAEIIGVKNGVI